MTEVQVRNKPGMVSVREMPVLQDGPPPGGFPPVRYARRIPTKGPSAVAIFLTSFGAFAWVALLEICWELKEEKYAARRARLPMLQAEEDERFVKERKNYLEEEARIMKDVPAGRWRECVQLRKMGAPGNWRAPP